MYLTIKSLFWSLNHSSGVFSCTITYFHNLNLCDPTNTVQAHGTFVPGHGCTRAHSVGISKWRPAYGSHESHTNPTRRLPWVQHHLTPVPPPPFRFTSNAWIKTQHTHSILDTFLVQCITGRWIISVLCWLLHGTIRYSPYTSSFILDSLYSKEGYQQFLFKQKITNVTQTHNFLIFHMKSLMVEKDMIVSQWLTNLY